MTTPDAGRRLEEAAALTSGASFWTTKEADGAVVLLTDGPHGVRKQAGRTDHLGLAASMPATCFPRRSPWRRPGTPRWPSAWARRSAGRRRGRGCPCSWARASTSSAIRACGRNFEYFSEDPLLTGALGVAWVRGLQGRGVGASLKHFAANNAETDRMRVSADVDARTLREIYLRAFERVVTRAQPWTVMCSYNRINGVYAAENEWLLSTCCAVSGASTASWSATGARSATGSPPSRPAWTWRCPAPGHGTDAMVLAAAEADDAVRRRWGAPRSGSPGWPHGRRGPTVPPGAPDLDAHHALAREVAGRCRRPAAERGRPAPPRARRLARRRRRVRPHPALPGRRQLAGERDPGRRPAGGDPRARRDRRGDVRARLHPRRVRRRRVPAGRGRRGRRRRRQRRRLPRAHRGGRVRGLRPRRTSSSPPSSWSCCGPSSPCSRAPSSSSPTAASCG